MLVEEYWYSLLLQLKMMSATSQSHRTESSIAFFIRPFLRLVNVTWRLRSSAMRWISILRRPTASAADAHPPRHPTNGGNHEAQQFRA